MKRLIASTALLSVLCLSACAPMPILAPKGQFTAGQASATLDRDWSDVSKMYFTGTGKKVHILTIDGLALNRVLVSEGLGSNDPLTINPMKGDTKSNPALRGKADMSLSEQMEFVSGSVAQLDYHKVEVASPKPVTISGVKGVRFELTGVTTDGLNVKGLAQAVSKGGLNYYVVYLAPAEHYYDATLPNAIALMDSVKLP